MRKRQSGWRRLAIKPYTDKAFCDALGRRIDILTYPSNNATRYTGFEARSEGLPAGGKRLPNLYEGRENCCGCGACAAICAARAIDMEPDEEGFRYPVVDAGKCVGCLWCENVCPIKTRVF